MADPENKTEEMKLQLQWCMAACQTEGGRDSLVAFETNAVVAECRILEQWARERCAVTTGNNVPRQQPLAEPGQVGQ